MRSRDFFLLLLIIIFVHFITEMHKRADCSFESKVSLIRKFFFYLFPFLFYVLQRTFFKVVKHVIYSLLAHYTGIKQ